MVSAAEIVDHKTLQAWLDGRSREVCVLIAHRAAMRVAPILWARPRFGQDSADLTTLRFQRLNLLAQAAFKVPTSTMREIAATAARPSYNAGTDVASDDAAAAAAAAAFVAAAPDAMYSGAADAAADAAYAVGHLKLDLDSATYTGADADTTTWAAVRADAKSIERDSLPQGLWPGPNPLASEWIQTREKWQAAGWDFWIDWYEDALAGREPDWTLLERVALIDPAIWDAGAQAVNAEIDRLIEELSAAQANPDTIVDRAIKAMASPNKVVVRQVKSAIAQNRHALPPTFDAIEGLIALEIELEQGRNHADDLELAESKRRISVLLVLHSAITRLRATIPRDGDVTDEAAVEVEKLHRLYGRKLSELPRSKADEVIEGAWSSAKGAVSVGLILSCGALAGYFGLPPYGGMVAGAFAFAPKNAGEIIKAAKDLVVSGKGT